MGISKVRGDAMPTHGIPRMASMKNGTGLLMENVLYPLAEVRHCGGDGPFVVYRLYGFTCR
jgi:hypothetical protein